MTGSKTNAMNRDEVLAAVRTTPAGGDFVWDGKDDDERPATRDELASAVATYRRKRGRPAGSATKVQVAIRFDRDVVDAFRASGPGWQTRMNDVLRDWVKARQSA